MWQFLAFFFFWRSLSLEPTLVLTRRGLFKQFFKRKLNLKRIIQSGSGKLEALPMVMKHHPSEPSLLSTIQLYCRFWAFFIFALNHSHSSFSYVTSYLLFANFVIVSWSIASDTWSKIHKSTLSTLREAARYQHLVNDAVLSWCTFLVAWWCQHGQTKAQILKVCARHSVYRAAAAIDFAGKFEIIF